MGHQMQARATGKSPVKSHEPVDGEVQARGMGRARAAARSPVRKQRMPVQEAAALAVDLMGWGRAFVTGSPDRSPDSAAEGAMGRGPQGGKLVSSPYWASPSLDGCGHTASDQLNCCFQGCNILAIL